MIGRILRAEAGAPESAPSTFSVLLRATWRIIWRNIVAAPRPFAGISTTGQDFHGKSSPSIYRAKSRFLRCKCPIQNSLVKFMTLQGPRTPPAFFVQKCGWSHSANRTSRPARDFRSENRKKSSRNLKNPHKMRSALKNLAFFHVPFMCPGVFEGNSHLRRPEKGEASHY